MKKFMLMILMTLVASIAISSCTDEVIQPIGKSKNCNPECGNGGGNVSDFPLR